MTFMLLNYNVLDVHEKIIKLKSGVFIPLYIGSSILYWLLLIDSISLSDIIIYYTRGVHCNGNTRNFYRLNKIYIYKKKKPLIYGHHHTNK